MKMLAQRWATLGVAAICIAGCTPRSSSNDAVQAHSKTDKAADITIGSVEAPSAEGSDAANAAVELTPDQFFDEASQSVVIVTNPEAQSMGSGVEIQPGLFVTNCHVLRNGSRYFLRRGKQVVSASLERADTGRDICLLSARMTVSRPVRIRSATEIRVGERVYALGNPEGFELTLSEGIVSQLRKATEGQDIPYIQTTAAISHGSSGGGIFDRFGNLIGITSFMYSEGQNLNFAAPIDWALELNAHSSPHRLQSAPEEAEVASEAETQPESAQELNDRATSLINANTPDEAIHLLERAVEMEPSNAELLGNLGYAYLRAERFAKANETLMAGLRISPKRASTWLNLGQAVAELGDSDLAVRCVLNGYKLSTRKAAVKAALIKASTDPAESQNWQAAARRAAEQL